jgi:four helix bundle protein
MTDHFIPSHGGYKDLLTFQKAEIVYDATVKFCADYFDRRDRTVDQMVQAARSGKQNIVEASMASGTSKEMEVKLTNVARASLEELLTDYRDFLRTYLRAIAPIRNPPENLIVSTGFAVVRPRKVKDTYLEPVRKGLFGRRPHDPAHGRQRQDRYPIHGRPGVPELRLPHPCERNL